VSSALAMTLRRIQGAQAHRDVEPRTSSEAPDFICRSVDMVRVLRLDVVQLDEKDSCSLSEAFEVKEEGHANDGIPMVSVIMP
jgi:hypothetical protein